MAFSCKLPNSRRQVWERSHGLSQFSILSQSPASQDDVDATGEVEQAGKPVRRATRTQTRGIELDNVSSSGDRGTSAIDCIDTPERILFSKVDVFFICISILLYIADIGLDCFVAVKHYYYIEKDSEPLYFGFTVAFILLAGVVTSIFSLWWYYFEYQTTKRISPKDLPTNVGLTVRIIACIFMLGPVVRYVDTILCGLRSRAKGITSERRIYYHEEMQFHRTDGAMLRLFEAFLESAPQFLLQVYIVFHKGLEGLEGEKEGNQFNFLVALTLASIISSMISLAWSVVAYHKANRMSRDDRQEIEHVGLAFRFLWRLFEISPRIVILAMFMSAFGEYLAIFAAIHFALMVVWLYKQHTDFCEKPRCEIVFVTVMGLVWCFCFFNLKDGYTRRTSLIYYTLFYAENIALTVAWYFKVADDFLWYRGAVVAIVLGSIVPMVLFMLIYYKCLHKENVKTCLPKDYWLPCTATEDSEDVVATSRYGKHDGNGVERERLTSYKRESVPSTISPTVGVDAVEVQISVAENSDEDMGGEVLSSIPAYYAPIPDRFERCESEEDIKPNLDDCTEINGYLEASVLGSKSTKLMRQDTIPKYMAPVPSNYGATVPGGAPAKYTPINRPAQDPSHGSTLPGAPTTATVVKNDKFVPYDDEEAVSSPTMELQHAVNCSKSSEKPPLPAPRLSVLAHQDSQFNKSLHEESNLTTVSELSEGNSTFLNQTLTPSPRRSLQSNKESSLDDSIMGIESHTGDTTINKGNTTGDGVSLASSIDTPLKDGRILGGTLDLSVDTPIKEAMKERSANS